MDSATFCISASASPLMRRSPSSPEVKAPLRSSTRSVVPSRDLAFDFLLFCQRNPKPCPLLDVTEPGSAVPCHCAPDADLRTDLPRYRLYQSGALADEPDDVTELWQPDAVAFLIGCSF